MTLTMDNSWESVTATVGDHREKAKKRDDVVSRCIHFEREIAIRYLVVFRLTHRSLRGSERGAHDLDDHV